MSRSFIWLLLGCLALPGPVHAESGPARAQLERFADGLDTLHAQFEQRVLSSDGAVEDASSGQVWLRRPQLFRWEYGGDFPELVVADGVNVWIYDEMLEQVTVKDQSQAAVDTPLTLLTDLAQIDRQFQVREVGEMGDLQLLELRSPSADSEFERILLGLAGDRLQLMIMEDAFGLRTEVTFSEIQLNTELRPGLFEFTPPENVDVIGEPAPRGEAGGSTDG